MTVAELLEKPEAWTKGDFARTLIGDCCRYDDPDAKCWCLLGAIEKIYLPLGEEAHDEAYDKISYLIDDGVTRWNDDPSRTHAEVLELVRKAGI